MNIKKHSILIWITLFAVSMGIFEGAVVVYLRALYYPFGFAFPLTPIDNQIAITELVREFASLIMLVSVGIISGKGFSQRFAWFIYAFAVWDIIYYVFLYLILGWPESLLTWDILFLLPVAWTGPVVAPIIISILMIVLALIIYKFNSKLGFFQVSKKEWSFLIVGSIAVFISFVWDYCRFLIQNITFPEITQKSFSDKLFDLSIQYIPESFPWIIFLLGSLIIGFGIYFLFIRLKNLSE